MDGHELECYREAGRIASRAREYGISLLKDGARVEDVAEDVEDFIRGEGARPAFPVGIGIDDVAAHYTPSHNDRLILRRGNLVKMDVGVHVDGYIADTARTVEIGTNRHASLIEAAEEALSLAINLMKPRTPLRILGEAVQNTIESYGYHPVRNLTGHSLRRNVLHSGLSIPSVKLPSSSLGKVREGDVVAIEPFATTGTGTVAGEKPGNIFSLGKIKSTGMKTVVENIMKEFGSLPFAQRWLLSNPATSMKDPDIAKLVKRDIIRPYPVLREINGGMVSQAEHTVIITRAGCEVTTL